MRRVIPWRYRLRCEIIWRLRPRRYWKTLGARHRWIFLVGVNRSGKTTLANLLAHHPDVSVVPNAANMSTALPNALSEGCPHIWGERVGRFRLTEQDAARVDGTRLLFDWLSFHRRPKPIILVEADVQAVQMRWLQHVFKDAHFIGLVRNGYAVAEALRMKEGYQIERCARHWATVNAHMLADAKLVERFLLVRYEDLVGDPSAATRQIADFAGLNPSPVLPVIATGWKLGNMDTARSRLRDANPELVGRLTPAEREAVTMVGRSLLTSLGYSPSPSGDIAEPAPTMRSLS